MKARAILVWVLMTCVVMMLITYQQFGFHLAAFLRRSFVRLNASDQYVVYECDGTFPCGGWADRQKGIVASYVLAKMLGRRYRIKMTTPCDLSTHLTSNNKTWEIRENELDGLSVKRVREIDSSANKLREKMTSMNITAEYPEDVLYFTSNMEYVEYLLKNQQYSDKTEKMRKMPLANLYVDILQKLFKLKPALKHRLANFSTTIPRGKGVRLACAQVRLGKNPTVPTDTETFNTQESVQAVWDFLMKYNNTEKYRIFVTSDSEDVRKTAKSIFPTTIVDLEGDIVHVERTSGSNVCDGFAKVLLDQLILSTCDVLVISRSGLARIAAWYRGRKEDVYCFSKAQVKPCDPYDLKTLIPSW